MPDRPCCSLDSINDARRVCERLGVPHYVLNLESAFGHDVIDNFVSEYAQGRTPIPCVRCNTFTKFRDLLHKADAIDADLIATGHYARVADGALMRARDANKDQTYFLWGIDRAVVRRMLLPVGELTKAETRARAHALGLEVVAEKPESQDICFVPDGDHVRVLEQHLGAGRIRAVAGPDRDGRWPDRRPASGLRALHDRPASRAPRRLPDPMYVVAIRPSDRAVVIGPREELLGRGVVAHEVNWLVDEPPRVGARVSVQVRHRASPAAAEVVRRDRDEVELALDEPVAAITPGQSLVIYDGDRVLGGGLIERANGQRTALPVLAA